MTRHELQAPLDLGPFKVAPYVLGHRVLARAELRAKGMDSYEVVKQVVDSVKAPFPVG